MTIGRSDATTYNVDLADEYRAYYNLAKFDFLSGPARVVTITLMGNIGSSGTGSAAIQTGFWPDGSIINLVIPADKYVFGCGGRGGGIGTTTAGAPGGPAINGKNGSSERFTLIRSGSPGVSVTGPATLNVVNNVPLVAVAVAADQVAGSRAQHI